MPPLLQLRKLLGKGDGEWKKSVFVLFYCWPEDYEFVEKMHFGASYWAAQWSWFAWVNALWDLSKKKLREVAASLPGRFLSRRCFTLWKLNLELRSSTNATAVAVAKITQEWGWRVEKKCLLCHFLADQKIVNSWKKYVLGHPMARATSYCLLPDTFWLKASKNVFKVGSVKFANSLSPPSIVKKVCTGSKGNQGTFLQCQAKVKRVNNPAWTTQ